MLTLTVQSETCQVMHRRPQIHQWNQDGEQNETKNLSVHATDDQTRGLHVYEQECSLRIIRVLALGVILLVELDRWHWIVKMLP